MILKLETFSGISGDMFLGALAPLLDAEDEIRDLPARLGLAGVQVEFSDVIRSTIRCRKATVTVHGHAPEAHLRDHSHPHHDDAHDHDHGHSHPHRAYRDIVRQVTESGLAPGVTERALTLFRLLGEAEAEMHGIPLEDVHFHEVGGEDALIDLVGAALLIDKLAPESVVCSPVCVGSGFVRTAHGRLPVPAPATQRLLEGMPTFPGPVDKEMTTPTGAAILKLLDPVFDAPVLTVSATGLGAGTRELDQPNALRVSLCTAAQLSGHEAITLLQTNLDNVTGEDLGSDLLSDLLDAGALDAWITPVIMKKGRPGQMLEVLSDPGAADRLATWILNRLPTLGVRRLPGSRTVLNRGSRTVSTGYGPIDCKIQYVTEEEVRVMPEYESCRKAAELHGVSVSTVREAARSAE